MLRHRIKHYIDGRIKIEYCSICGKEDRELIDEPECVVDKKDINQSDFFAKDVDKASERN